ncbi:MAG: hypothetical protein Q7R49_01940 [Candidatus Daviesbacteria bacterium]|nr:hypothetical protein [Candidatus Daviesbacteria bacterium]
MLESLDRTNIGSLNLTEPAAPQFDFAKLMTPDDLTRCQTTIKNFSSGSRTIWSLGYQLMFELGVIIPEKSSIPMVLSMQPSYYFADPLDELEGWAYIKLFRPEFFAVFSELRGEHFKQAKESIYPYLEEQKSSITVAGWPDQFTFAPLDTTLLIAKFVFPNDQTTDLIDSLVPELVGGLGNFPESTASMKINWLNTARTLRILKPKVKSKLMLPNNLLDEGKALLEYSRNSSRSGQSSHSYFLDVLSAMKILTAEDLQMTSEGLKVIMQNDFDFQEKTPGLPETRKF